MINLPSWLVNFHNFISLLNSAVLHHSFTHLTLLFIIPLHRFPNTDPLASPSHCSSAAASLQLPTPDLGLQHVLVDHVAIEEVGEPVTGAVARVVAHAVGGVVHAQQGGHLEARLPSPPVDLRAEQVACRDGGR